jgi:hypothetical protein
VLGMVAAYAWRGTCSALKEAETEATKCALVTFVDTERKPACAAGVSSPQCLLFGMFRRTRIVSKNQCSSPHDVLSVIRARDTSWAALGSPREIHPCLPIHSGEQSLTERNRA